MPMRKGFFGLAAVAVEVEGAAVLALCVPVVMCVVAMVTIVLGAATLAVAGCFLCWMLMLALLMLEDIDTVLRLRTCKKIF
jgi:hypothetical protein